LKPENILFRGAQSGDTAARVESGDGALGFHEPVITDFGLAVSPAFVSPCHIIPNLSQVHVPDHRELQPLQRAGCPPLPPHDPSRDVTYLGKFSSSFGTLLKRIFHSDYSHFPY
jgi:hypothetical protein